MAGLGVVIRIRDERPGNRSSIPGRATYSTSYYFFLCEVFILVSVRKFFPKVLHVVPRPVLEPTPSVQWVPGSVSEAVTEIQAEQLPLSSANAKDV